VVFNVSFPQILSNNAANDKDSHPGSLNVGLDRFGWPPESEASSVASTRGLVSFKTNFINKY